MRLLIIAMAAMLAACTSERQSLRVLEESGYTNINVGDYAFFACSDDDTFHTKFMATNAQGKRVHGVVCCGILKSCTVRF